MKTMIVLNQYVKLAESMFAKVLYVGGHENYVHEYAIGVKVPMHLIAINGGDAVTLVHLFGIALLSKCAEALGLTPSMPVFCGRLEFVSATSKPMVLVWRIKPELEVNEDFDTKTYKYSIYARFGVVPEGVIDARSTGTGT